MLNIYLKIIPYSIHALIVFVSATLMVFLQTTYADAHPRLHRTYAHETDIFTSLTQAEQSQFNLLKDAFENEPENAATAVALARYSARQARRLGDTTLLRFAAQTLARWDSRKNAPTNVLLVRANIRQIDHRFDDALADINIVIKREPYNPQARLSRAFILATVGRAQEADADCAALRPNVPIYIRETCAARIRSLTGSINDAFTRMEAVLGALEARSSTERSFALAITAEIAERIGSIENAENYYKELLEIDPRSVYARAEYADFLLSQERRSDARRIIGDAPNTEVLLLLRILTSEGAMDMTAREAAAELGARMASDRIKRDFSHAREYARYAMYQLKDASLALEMAKENWRAQKEPIDALILVESAAAAGDAKVITEVEAWVSKTQLEDRMLKALLAAQKTAQEPQIKNQNIAHGSVIE